MGNNKEKLKAQRLGRVNYNEQGYLMKIIKYNSASDIIIEFQDKYKAQVHSRYERFKSVDNK